MVKGTIAKTLVGIALAGSLTSCKNDYSQYQYGGRIGEEKVKFCHEEGFWSSTKNTLMITKPEGKRSIEYIDSFGNDLKLEYVKIVVDSQETTYGYSDEAEKQVVEAAQKQFDSYLQQIKELKIKQGLENLK